MKFFLHMFFCTVLTPTMFFLCSCQSSKDTVVELTPKELGEVVYHARNFIVTAKKIRLMDEERAIIRDMKPEIDLRYHGYKSGRMTIEWRLPTNRLVRLTSVGDFLAKKPRWTVNLLLYEAPTGDARFVDDDEDMDVLKTEN